MTDKPELDGGHNETTVAKAELRAFIERIERLEEEKKELTDDIKSVYAEAKGSGYDTKTMKEMVKLRGMDREKLAEREHFRDLYGNALGVFG